MRAAEPVYFASAEAPERPCFGWIHESPVQGDTAVLICAPLGYEFVCAHRGMRVLAETLAAAGLSAMRFDYDGVGDSAGSEHDANRVGAWLLSMRAAERVLRERTGASRIIILAFRVGCALALEALPDMPSVAQLVFVAPLSGTTFVRELQAFAKLGSPPDELEWTDEGAQVAGYWMSRDALEGLRQLGKRTHTAESLRMLVIPRDDIPQDDPRMTAQLSRCGIVPDVRNANGYEMLMADPHKSEVSATLRNAVVSFCTEHASLEEPASRDVVRPIVQTASATIGSDDIAVREIVARVGADLLGVRTVPKNGVKSGTPLIVMLNAGAVHHIGVNRSHVILARQLAQRGTSSIRLDLEGLGDSAVGDDAVAPRLYSTRSLQTLVTTLTALRDERKIVVIGLCAGAYSAYHAALQQQVDGVILINPQTFSFKEGDTLDVASSRSVYKDAASVRGSMLQLSSWKRVVQGRVDVARSVRIVAHQGWLRTRTKGSQVLTTLGIIQTTDVERKLTKLADLQTKTHFIFSKSDPGLDYLDEVLSGRTQALIDKEVVELSIIEGADHTFTPRGTQDVLLRLITDWLADKFGV